MGLAPCHFWHLWHHHNINNNHDQLFFLINNKGDFVQHICHIRREPRTLYNNKLYSLIACTLGLTHCARVVHTHTHTQKSRDRAIVKVAFYRVKQGCEVEKEGSPAEGNVRHCKPVPAVDAMSKVIYIHCRWKNERIAP